MQLSFDMPAISGAQFSDCGKYRYKLSRTWDRNKGTALFIMLNPSTADASVNDPTVRRCINFAKSWGYGRLYVGNIFALRSTDPKALYGHDDPIGVDNDKYLLEMYEQSDIVIAAWGNHGALLNRSNQVIDLINGDLCCLGQTNIGEPRHPLYLPKNLQPVLLERK